MFKIFQSILVRIIRKLSINKFRSYGSNSTIGRYSIFRNKERISIGRDTDIGSFVHVWGTGNVYIGNRVLIASHVTITTLTHSYNYETIKFAPVISKQIVINDDVWIGSNSVILPGVELGEGCIVGAGSVVTKNVPPLAIVVGVPAKVIKYRQILKKNN